ncbi:hypothetical protein ACR56S_04115 [Staphylococcus hominis]|mgnify:CR=1 FL=1|uniref:hypothetical protein n=1 Tax=Staphylococcus hominis TaxID=1290 RepID=UPI003DA11399
MSSNIEKLKEVIVNNSVSDNWHEAVNEWDIEGCEENQDIKGTCICGKENLRYLFTIVNSENNNLVFPIGSKCIKTFERSDLNKTITIHEQLHKLLRAVEDNKFIKMNSEYFSRNLLQHLYDIGALNSNNPNFSAYGNYEFLLSMFNQRKEPTVNQRKRISAIILGSIKPYLKKNLIVKKGEGK